MVGLEPTRLAEPVPHTTIVFTTIKTLGCPFVSLAIDFSSNLPDFYISSDHSNLFKYSTSTNSTTPRKKKYKSIQTISVVTFVSSLMDSSLQPLVKLELYQYFYILVSNHFMKLFYNVSQLEMLFVC